MGPYTKYNKSKLRRSTGGTISTRSNRITKTKSTRNNIISKQSLKSPVKKTVKPPRPTFIGTQGEDDLEANLSFLIELMGGSIIDTYVNNILNKELEQKNERLIEVKNVNKPMNPDNSLLNKGNPIIFYGKVNGTHFTSTLGKGELVDSYKTGVQLMSSDHFCQTFSLMFIEHYYFPNSFIGQKYKELSFNGDIKGYIDNVMIAIEVACHVLKLVNTKKMNKDNNNIISISIFNALNEKERSGELSHKLNESVSVYVSDIVNLLTKYCKSITKKQIFYSTFIQKIFNLTDDNDVNRFRNENLYIIQ